VFARDGHRCQYCGGQAENIDHVVPRSRGGLHDWENVVAACRRCNTRKEDRLPEEAGFVLRRPPRRPRSRVWLLAAGGDLRSEWAPYVTHAVEAAV
jgi:5-methylcytosine-specific restriction endonuclease McrA